MPLKVKLTVGENTFEVENDAMDPTIVDLAQAWVGALPPADGAEADAKTAEALRAETGKLKDSRETLAATTGRSEAVA